MNKKSQCSGQLSESVLSHTKKIQRSVLLSEYASMYRIKNPSAVDSCQSVFQSMTKNPRAVSSYQCMFQGNEKKSQTSVKLPECILSTLISLRQAVMATKMHHQVCELKWCCQVRTSSHPELNQSTFKKNPRDMSSCQCAFPVL